MKRLILPLVLLLTPLLAASDKPNVIWILVDDMGWMDLACQGNDKLETPNIDGLAAGGMRFTDAYSPSPVCSPTRASLMTGLSPARLKITNHIPDQERFIPDDAKWLPAKMLDHLPLKHETIAERLATRGYTSGFFGKWHLCGRTKRGDMGAGDRSLQPEGQGFAKNVGGCAYGGPPTFFDPYRIDKLPPRKKGEYLPDRLADEVIEFIEDQGEKPFLACLWNYTVHWPMEAPEEYLARYKGKEGPGIKDIRYAAMIEAFDDSIGKLLAALDRMKLREKTLIVFTSDNGAYGGVSDMRPLREAKGYLYEGGIRVPLIVNWPGVIKPKQTNSTPVIGTDLFFTILEACGAKPSGAPADGMSLMPLLKGEEMDRGEIYFHYPNYAFHRGNRLGSAVRSGKHKLIEYVDGGVELYNLEADISEKDDIARKHPGVVAKLRRKLADYLRETDAELPIQAKAK